MTTTLFDDLGERLDAIAAAHTDHVELRHPNELPIGDAPDASSNRMVWLAAAAVLIAVAAVWIGLRDGADLETEEPAADPDATLELAYADLPSVFSYDPLPADDPVIAAKAQWWNPDTVRVMRFEGADVYLASPIARADRVCIDAQAPPGTGFAAGGEGMCLALTSYLAGLPLVIVGQTQPGFIAGLLPVDATGMSTGGNGVVQLNDGVYFAALDTPGVLLEPVGGADTFETVGSLKGELNGVPIDDPLSGVGCVWNGDSWWVAAQGTTYGFRLGVDVAAVFPLRDSSTPPAVLDAAAISRDTSASGVQLTLEFDQPDAVGETTFTCVRSLDWADFTAGWFGS